MRSDETMAASGQDAAAEPQFHTHSHEHTRVILHRLSRAIGHLESVKTMVETGRDCTDVLIQLAAVRGALRAVSRIVLKDHMEHCIVDALEQGDTAALDDFIRAMDQVL